MRTGVFGQTWCELAVSPLHERTIGMDIMSDWGTRHLPRIVNLKQHEIPGRWKEILALINDILEVPANVLYDSSVWPFSVKKADSSWTQTVGYWGLNKAVMPIAPAAPEMVPTVQKLRTRGDWSAVIDPAIPTSVNCNLPSHRTDPCSDPQNIYCVATELFEFTSLLLWSS